jgi:thioredoxin 1
MSNDYQATGPTRAELDAMPGSVVVEFGTGWCGHCQAARKPVEDAMASYPDVAYIRIEDGRGRPAGRSYGVKLWPTLVFLADGREVARVVRPTDSAPVTQALAEQSAVTQSDG